MKHILDQKLKHRATHRAKIMVGQLQGLVKAIDREDYCPSILIQSLAIQKSLKSLDTFLLENHLKTHVAPQIKDSNQEILAIKELIMIYTLSSK